MTRTIAWSPAEGPCPAPQQQPPSGFHYSGDGSHDRVAGELWAPSEGPVRSDPGGPGGEPDGETVIQPRRDPGDW